MGNAPETPTDVAAQCPAGEVVRQMTVRQKSHSPGLVYDVIFGCPR